MNRTQESWRATQARNGSRVARRDARTGDTYRGRHPYRRLSLIVASYLIAVILMAVATTAVLHSRSDTLAYAQPPSQTARYLVLIVLDGARPDYFGLTSLPHVDALRASGTQYTNAVAGILESETPSGHTTIATGATPAKNGILGFDWAQNDNDFSLFSPDVVRAGAMEHIMEAAHVPTIASLYKAAHPTARVVALSGHKYYAADPLGGPAADAIMYYQGDAQGRYVPVAIPGHTPPAGVLDDPSLIAPSTTLPPGKEDSLATQLALTTFAKMHQQITLINYPEFDWPLGHVDGGSSDPKATIALMKSFDRDLGRIEDAYRKAGILDQTLFVITADHGMTPVTRFVPQSVITNAVSKAGTTAPSISYSTGGYVWLTDPSKAPAVAQNVWTTKDPGVESVYYLTSIHNQPTYQLSGGSLAGPDVQKAEQYLLNTLLNGHEPNVVVFYKEGSTGSDPNTHWKADHGGAGWQSQHIPLILSGAGVRSGLKIDQPAQMDDIAPTVLAAMGVRATGMEGQVLTEAVPSSNAKVNSGRQAEINQVTPVVSALNRQETYSASH